MAKRNNGTGRTNDDTTTNAPGATPADAMEQRVLVFAEQLGRLAGTFQAKAKGWMDRDALNRQIASVRDDAAALLDQLADGAAKATKVFEASKAAQAGKPAQAAKPTPAAKTAKKTPAAAPQAATARGRSGGGVDAPGKKHRKPTPSDPGANVADSQAAKVRAAKTMEKTSKRRGRG